VATPRGDVHGRAWISADDFGIVRLELTQPSRRGPIVSSEQRDDFVRVDVAGVPAWLPRRIEIHQMFEGPTHRTPIDRVVEITAHAVNPADFDAQLRAARAGSGIMLRQTGEGFR